MKFFISYNHSDASLAQAIAKSLDEEGIAYFLDEKDIGYGLDILAEVSKNLANSTHMAVIISPDSSKSTWVPYEIGVARANGLKIVPVLQHPAIDLPAYIASLKYCKDLDEFKRYIATAYEGDLPVSVDIQAAEAIMLDEDHIVFAVQTLDKDYDAADPNEPALLITVKNKSGTEIELTPPSITFKKPQVAVISGEEISGIGVPFSLQEQHVVSPNAESTFHLYHPKNTNPQTSLMRGIILALLNDNVAEITIESQDKRKKVVRPQSIATKPKIIKYFQQRFPPYCS